MILFELQAALETVKNGLLINKAVNIPFMGLQVDEDGQDVLTHTFHSSDNCISVG